MTNGGGRAKFRSVAVATRSDIKTTPGRVPAPGSPPSIYICVYKIDGTPEDCGLCKDYEVLPAESRFLFFTKNHLYSPPLSSPPLSLSFRISLLLRISYRVLSHVSFCRNIQFLEEVYGIEHGKIARYILKTSSEW